jgi:protein TonB
MTNRAKFNPASALSNNDTLLLALIFAVLVHLGIVLGINFTNPTSVPHKINRAIDVTFVTTPTKQAPKEAQFLAPENQIGTGEKKAKPEPPRQQLPNQGAKESKPAAKPAEEESKPKSVQKVLTQKTAVKKVVTEGKPADGETEHHPRLTAESLQQQIAQLGTEIRLSQQSSDNNRIKFVDSVSTHKYVAAQYIKDWERKVERTGNLNYPEVAARKNFSGILTMDVGIKADGSIYSMRINKSSGNSVLDEAAKRIVRISAPFPPLPIELQKELDVLVITRVWKFSDESGMTAR